MISIVIPTYNASRFMPALLDSIFSQAVDDMEVIIVDDCSTDNTVEIVQKHPVRVIQMEKNGGPARARNRGVKEARGDIIFFLDSDVLVMDGTIREVRDYFEKNPSAQCTIGICSTEPLNKGFVSAYMAMFEYIHLIGQKYDKVSVFAPRCGAIKKDFFWKVGGYAENYKGADVEDFELARRINKEDCIILNPKIMVKHQFADFKQALKIYFKRTVMWVHLFFKEKQLDNAGPTSPSNGIAAICAFLSFLLIFIMPFVSFAKPAFWLLIAVYLFSNLKWWNFMRKEAGLMFAVKALLLNYILGIEIMGSAAYAALIYPFSDREVLTDKAVEKNLVVLGYANASPFPYHAWTPLAILSIGAYLEQNDIEVEYFDERIHKKERFIELVQRKPLFIGLSTMTCFQIKNTINLAKTVRKISPDTPLVWGGTHPSMMAQQTLESDLVDFVIKGEGEQTLLELARALQEGKTGFAEIEGLGWKQNGKNILNDDRDFLDIEDLPFPYQGKGKDILLEYIRRSGDTLENIGYESSRGCPHKCGFCYNVFFHKNVCRVKSVEKVRSELLSLKELGVDKMTFYDDTFLAGKKDLMSNILDLLRELNFEWIANVRINTFNDELLQKFKDSGCVYLFFGVESPDDEILKFIRKGQNRRMIDEGISVVSKGTIPTLYSLIIGLPGETEEQMNRTLDFADEIRRRHPGAEVPIQPYVPLPGTSLYEEALKKGFQPPTHLEGWKNFTNDEVRNPWIKNPELLHAIYINSFLAFRYDRFLKNFWSRLVFGPLHKLSLWRWKHRNYNYFIEIYLYLTYKRMGRFFILLEKMIKNQ
jgi:radical SAM superfamily enzyme YgiQ (UPF0313 family)/glycosyltransferase involved in cell wall biosynthesis